MRRSNQGTDLSVRADATSSSRPVPAPQSQNSGDVPVEAGRDFLGMSSDYSSTLSAEDAPLARVVADYLSSYGTLLGTQVGAIVAVAREIEQARLEGRTVFVFGNGACAALASHMACDLQKILVSDRDDPLSDAGTPRARIVPLGENMALMTAIGNDLHFEDIFLEQVRALAKRDDVLIGLSASGESINVLRAMVLGRRIGCLNIAMTGSMSKMPRIAEESDICIQSPLNEIDQIEDTHVIFHHALVRAYASIPRQTNAQNTVRP